MTNVDTVPTKELEELVAAHHLPDCTASAVGPKHRVWIYRCGLHGESAVWNLYDPPEQDRCSVSVGSEPPMDDTCMRRRTLVGPGREQDYAHSANKHTSACDIDCGVCFPNERVTAVCVHALALEVLALRKRYADLEAVSNKVMRSMSEDVVALRKQVALAREALEDIVRGGLRVDVDNVSRAQDALDAMTGERDG